MNYVYQGRTNIIVESPTFDGTAVIGLCGGGGSPAGMQASVSLETLFPNKHILYAAPDTAIGSLWRIQDVGRLDFKYLNGLHTEFMNMYGITYPNITIFGVSLGAMMGLRTVSILDEVGIKNVVCISGTYTSPEAFDVKCPIMMVNCIHDATVPFNGGNGYNSVTSTYEAISKSLGSFKPLIIGTQNTALSDHHSYANIKVLYPTLESEIQAFVG